MHVFILNILFHWEIRHIVEVRWLWTLFHVNQICGSIDFVVSWDDLVFAVLFFPEEMAWSYRWSVCSVSSVFSVAEIWAVITVKPLKIHLLLSHSVFLVTSCVSSGFILSLSCLREVSLWKTPGLVASSSLVAAFIQHNLFTWKVSVSEHSKTSAREDMNDCRVEEVCGSDTQFNPAGR